MTFEIAVAALLRHQDRHTAGQCHVALVIEQALAGVIDRHQRGGAGRLNAHTRPRQVELVRDARRQVIHFVAKFCDQIVHCRNGVAVRQQVVRVIIIARLAGKDADAAGIVLRYVPGVLQGVPGNFHNDAMLRIIELRLTRCHVEETGIEAVGIVEHPAAPHEIRIVADCIGIDAGLGKFFVGECRDRFTPSQQVRPERIDVLGCRQTPCQADNGDTFEGIQVVVLITHLRLRGRCCASTSRWRRARSRTSRNCG